MADIFADLVSDISPSGDMFADIVKAKPEDLRKGFGEAFVEKPLGKIPFSPYAAIDVAATVQSANRLNSGDYERFVAEEQKTEQLGGIFGGYRRLHVSTPESLRQEDVKRVTEYFEDVSKGYDLGGKVGSIVSGLPAFAIEFLATGGLKNLGSKLAQNTGEKILKESAKKGLGKAVVGISKFGIGAGARAIAMPHRGAEAIISRRLPENITIDDLDNLHLTMPDEKVWTSIWKGTLDHYIEIASEQAGEYMGPIINKHIVGRLPFLGKLTGALQRTWMRKYPNKTASDFLKKLYRKGGFHGVLAEVGEEDLGWISRAILDVEDYGAGKDASIGERLKAGLSQDIENLPAELIAFSVPGAAQRGTSFLLSKGATLPEYNVVKVNTETDKVISQEGSFDSPLTAYDAVKEKTTPDDRYNKIEYEIREPGESLTKPRIYDETGTAEEAYAAEKARKEEELKKGQWTYEFKQPKGRYLVRQTNKEGEVTESRFETEEEAQLYKQGAEAMLPVKERSIIEIIKMTKDGKRPAVLPEESYYKKPPSDVPTFIETAEGTMGYDPGIYNIPEVEQLALAAEMTYEEAYQLYTDINNTSKRGLSVKKAKSLVDALSVHLKKENPTPRLSQGFFKDVYNKTLKGLKTYHYSMARIYQVLKDMDGGNEGPLINTVYKPMKNALVQSHIDRNNLQPEILNFFIDNDINLTKLFKSSSRITEKGKTFKISPLQKIQVYLNTLNPNNLTHLQNTLSQKNIDQIVNSLTEEEITVAQWLLGKYSEGFDSTANVYKQSTGQDLEQIDNYIHIDVEKDFVNFQQDLEEETITRRKKILRKAPRGFTKERTRSNAPLRLRDALSAFVDHEMKRRHYTAVELNAKDVLQQINDPKLSQRLNNTTGVDFKNLLNKWVNDSATERVEEINNWFNKFMSGMRRNYVTYALGFNLVTSMRQPISFWLASAKDPLVLVNSLTHAHKLSTDYDKYSKEAFEKSNILKARFMERELKELAMLKSPKKVLGKKISRENAFAFIRATDKTTVTAVWQGAYQAAQQRGMKSVDAVQYADSIITTTQPMGGLEDLPDIFRGGTFAKMFTAFQNQVNQQYNFWAFDVLQAKRKGRINNMELAWRVMMGHIIPAFIMGLVSRGRLPDEKEVLTDQAGYLIMPLYFFGNLVNNLIQGYGGRETLPLQVYDDIADIKEHKGLRSKIKAGLRATGRGFGLPLNQPIRSMEGALDLFNQEDTDYRRLVWSKHMLREREEPSTKRPTLRRRKRGKTRSAR